MLASLSLSLSAPLVQWSIQTCLHLLFWHQPLSAQAQWPPTSPPLITDSKKNIFFILYNFNKIILFIDEDMVIDFA